MSTMLLALSMVIKLNYKVNSELHGKLMINQLHFELLSALNDRRSMYYMCNQIAQLRRCFDKGATSCPSDGEFIDSPIIGPSGQRLSGTSADPVFRSKNGDICDPSENCPLRVISNFYVQGRPRSIPFSTCPSWMCRLFEPSEYPPATDELHELLVFTFTVSESSHSDSDSDPQVLTSGSFFIELNDRYGGYSGCPPL